MAIHLRDYEKIGKTEYHARVSYPDDLEPLAYERSQYFPTLEEAAEWALAQPSQHEGFDRFAQIEECLWVADDPIPDDEHGLVLNASPISYVEDGSLGWWVFCDDGEWQKQVV